MAQAAVSPQATGWVAAGVPEPLAQRVACAAGLFSALDIADVAEAAGRDVAEVAEVHSRIGERLGLSRLAQQIDALAAEGYWQSLAKGALGDDLAGLQRSIAQEVIAAGSDSPEALLQGWGARNADALDRAMRLVAELGDAKAVDLAMLSVALRELRHLA